MITPEPNRDDRTMAALRALIFAELAQWTRLGLWEYVVTATHDDGTIDGTPTDPLTPLPDLARVPLGALAAGGVSSPAVGARFLVDFLNGDGASYACFSVDPTVQVATVDATQELDVGPSAGTVNLGPANTAIARDGDGLTVFLPIGQLTGVITVSPGPPPVTVPMPPTQTQILNPVPGVITGGNQRVHA